MNALQGVEQCLVTNSGEVLLSAEMATAARKPLQRMLDFAANKQQRVAASGDLVKDRELFADIGAA